MPGEQNASSRIVRRCPDLAADQRLEGVDRFIQASLELSDLVIDDLGEIGIDRIQRHDCLPRSTCGDADALTGNDRGANNSLCLIN